VIYLYGMNESSKDKLFKKVMELIYGDLKTTTKIETKKQVKLLKNRLLQWKNNDKYKELIGPLQPAFVLGYILQLSEKTVNKVAKELDVALPKEINFEEFDLENLTEEIAIDILDKIESSMKPEEELISFIKNKKKSFEFIDLDKDQMSNFMDNNIEDSPYNGTLKAISYLQEIIKKQKNNEVHSMTIITLLKNGKVSIWLPEQIEESEMEELYEPIIELLSLDKTTSTDLN